MKQMFTSTEVAQILNTTPREVHRLFDEGRIRGYRVPGSRECRIPRQHLRRYVKQNNIPCELDGDKEADAAKVAL